MIPTPERLRVNRIGSAAAGVALGGALTAAGWFPAETVEARAALVVGSAMLGVFVYRLATHRFRRRLRLLAQPFPPEWEKILAARVAFYRSLGGDEKARFRKMVQFFLDEKRIVGVDCGVDDTCRLLVAASAVIPIFGFAAWEYDELREVLVYPDVFEDPLATDEYTDDELLGLVGDTGSAMNGVMILSKPDLYDGFKDSAGKEHVGIHEFVHYLDKGDGEIEGIPPNLPRESVRAWMTLVRKELRRGYVRHGRAGTQFVSDIPEYAFSSEEEFLAVVSEYFFKSPGELAALHPHLYSMLAQAYGQDPRKRFRNAFRQAFRPRQSFRPGRRG